MDYPGCTPTPAYMSARSGQHHQIGGAHQWIILDARLHPPTCRPDRASTIRSEVLTNGLSWMHTYTRLYVGQIGQAPSDRRCSPMDYPGRTTTPAYMSARSGQHHQIGGAHLWIILDACLHPPICRPDRASTIRAEVLSNGLFWTHAYTRLYVGQIGSAPSDRRCSPMDYPGRMPKPAYMSARSGQHHQIGGAHRPTLAIPAYTWHHYSFGDPLRVYPRKGATHCIPSNLTFFLP